MNILLFYIYFYTTPLVSGQNQRANNCTKVGVSAINTDNNIDSIKLSIASLIHCVDTMNEELSQIRLQVDTISNNSNTFIEKFRQECYWNKTNSKLETWLTIIGLLLSILSIVAVICVYRNTRKDTNIQIDRQHKDTLKQINSQEKAIEKQIKEQHKDTERRIIQQYELSEKQLNKMKEHSDERNKKLIQLGRQIQTSTGKIENSVKHLEQRTVLEFNKAQVDALFSSVNANYDALCVELENGYAHFISNPNNSSIHQKAASLKYNIRNISQILYSCSKDDLILNSQSYLVSIDEVVDRPNLQNKREQIRVFKEEGKKFNNQLMSYIKTIFNNE